MDKKTLKDYGFVMGQLILLALIFSRVVAYYIFEPSIYSKAIGISMCSIGMVIILLAILQLNRNLTPFPTPLAHSSLITNGLYRYVRHPIYSGLIMTSVGFAIYHSDVIGLSLCIGLFLLLFQKSKYEETMLNTKFCEYEAYVKTTWRMFPYVV